jgi:hypothetical protein
MRVRSDQGRTEPLRQKYRMEGKPIQGGLVWPCLHDRLHNVAGLGLTLSLFHRRSPAGAYPDLLSASATPFVPALRHSLKAARPNLKSRQLSYALILYVVVSPR